MPDKPNILNLTLPLKQDADSQAKLKQFAEQFPTVFLPQVLEVLKQSQMVHYCRFVVIGEPPKYLQVLTEYDIDLRPYTDFFATRLHDFFGSTHGPHHDAQTLTSSSLSPSFLANRATPRRVQRRFFTDPSARPHRPAHGLAPAFIGLECRPGSAPSHDKT